MAAFVTDISPVRASAMRRSLSRMDAALTQLEAIAMANAPEWPEKDERRRQRHHQRTSAAGDGGKRQRNSLTLLKSCTRPHVHGRCYHQRHAPKSTQSHIKRRD